MFNNKAMLADLTVSLWNAKKFDQDVTTATTTQFNASSESGRFNKYLIDKSLIKPIAAARSALEEYHKTKTAPWHQGGGRMLPSVLFMEYTSEMRRLKTIFEGEVHNFLAKYPAEVIAAQTSLGQMYNPGDYPHVQDLKQKFGVIIDLTPMPDLADFRTTMIQEAADEAAAAMKDTYERKEKIVVRDGYRRAQEVVQKMYEVLSDPDKIFRDSLVGNVETVADLLPALNLTDDPGLTNIAVAMKSQLCHGAAAIRANPELRQQIANSASAVLSQLAAGTA